MSESYPEVVSRFYDVIYGSLRSGADTEFYLNEILSENGKILEAGSGTGRLFIEALKKGADIYALDVSKSMLDVLKEKLPEGEHFRLKQGDIRNVVYPNKFALILAPFRVFSHLLGKDEQLEALNHIAELLQDNGTFIFDLYVPDPAMIASGLNKVIDFDGEWKPACKLRRITSMHADIVNQLSHVEMCFDWDEDDGSHQETWKFSLRFYFRYELEHLISLSNLRIKNFWGDFNKSSLNEQSKEFIVVCEKKY